MDTGSTFINLFEDNDEEDNDATDAAEMTKRALAPMVAALDQICSAFEVKVNSSVVE